MVILREYKCECGRTTSYSSASPPDDGSFVCGPCGGELLPTGETIEQEP